MAGLYAFFSWALMTAFASLWGVPFLKTAYGFSTTEAGSLCALIWLGVGLTSPIIGALSDMIGRRNPLFFLTALIGAIGIAVVIYVPNLPIYLLGIALFFAGIGSAGQILSFAVVKDNAERKRTSTSIGFNNMAVVASDILVRPIVGRLLEAHSVPKTATHSTYAMEDLHVALLILPICFVLCAVLAFGLIKETYCGKKNMKKHVIFDIGNVLLYCAPSDVIAKQFPEVPNPYALSKTLFYHQLWKDFDKGLNSSEQVRQDMANYLGWSVSDADKLMQSCKESLVAKHDSVDYVKSLHEDGHRLFCLSNMPVEFFDHLQHAHDFWHHFEHITISGAIQMAKPDADIYHYVLETNNLKAQDCIFLDDLQENIDTANSVGIYGAYFTDLASLERHLLSVGSNVSVLFSVVLTVFYLGF